MGEEQILVVAVREPRETRGEPDQRLLDTAEAATSQTRVDADAHLLATPRRRDPSGNVIGRASLGVTTLPPMAQVSPDPGFWSGKRVNVTGGVKLLAADGGDARGARRRGEDDPLGRLRPSG